jgi:Na+-transporting methylmalonyl-CoA/oxaloacetate decarboxylase gamma subunit
MKKKKRSRRWSIFLLLFFVSAFMLWFFWRDIAKVVQSVWKKPAAEKSQKRSQEKISEDERKKLEEILKRK